MGSTKDSQQSSIVGHQRGNLPLLLQSGWTGHLIAQRMIRFRGVLWISAVLMPGEASC